eukprot:scaffold5472_cov146-Skeletonema_menzelii.AAC.7
MMQWYGATIRRNYYAFGSSTRPRKSFSNDKKGEKEKESEKRTALPAAPVYADDTTDHEFARGYLPYKMKEERCSFIYHSPTPNSINTLSHQSI